MSRICVFQIFAAFAILYIQLISASHDVCGNNNRFGVGNNNEYDNDNPAKVTNKAYLHTGPDGLIDCCGVLDSFDFEIEEAGELYIQFWIDDPAGSGGYELVKSIHKSCANTDRCTGTFTGADKITVKDGYYWGWWSPNDAFVEYDNKNGQTMKTVIIGSEPTVGSVHFTAGVTTTTDDTYGVEINADPNNDPDFTTLPGTKSISETLGVGQSVFDVIASDDDVSDDDSLVISMDDNTYFDYTATTSTTGIVTVKAGLGPATSPQTLAFTVLDQCHNSRSRSLAVTITNEPPVFENMPNGETISELVSTSISLFVMIVTDNHDTVTCNIAGVTPATAGGNSFQISKLNDTAFELSTTNTAEFDFSASTFHNVAINCNDGDATVSSTFTLSLTPNDAPVIYNLPNATTISEDVDTETFLYRLSASDPDNIYLSCDLGSDTSAAAMARFRVKQMPGTTDYAIYTTDEGFVYDTQDTFFLSIECDDSRDTTKGLYTVYLQANMAPILTNLPDTKILSVDAAPSVEVFIASSTDNEGDQVYYEIQGCSPVGITQCPFVIFHDGRVVLNASLDEGTVGYDVTIHVYDEKNHGISDTKILTVIISDINAAPVIPNLNTAVNVAENVVIGTPIETATCTDSNVPADTLTFSMDCTPTWGNSHLSIDTNSGAIESMAAINYEAISAPLTTTCTVTCYDGQATDTATLDVTIIDVNEPPYFTQSGYIVNVDEGNAGVILTPAGFNVTDEDVGDTTAYTLDCGADTGYFIVNSNNGLIRYSTNYDLEDGLPQSASCTLTVTDSGGLTDSVPVDITINDVNDNSPIFSSGSYSFFVGEHATGSTPLGTVLATDLDISSFGDVDYTIDQTAVGCDCFGITPAGGVFVKSAMSLLGPSTQTFTVIATDGGGVQTTVTVTVVITDTTTVPFEDRYKTFFDDARNIGWFAPCMVLLAACGAFIVYLLLTMKSSSAAFKCQCCKVRRVFKPNHSRPDVRVFPQRRPDYKF